MTSDPAIGKASSFGVYDIAARQLRRGRQRHDTASFAAATIGRRWDLVGSRAHPSTALLLIAADSGWLQQLPHQARIEVWQTVRQLAELRSPT